MAISFVAAGTFYENSGATTGTATPTLPSLLADDLILAFYMCRNAGVAFTTPTDFTLARAFTGATYPGSRLCYKVATGSDANPASDWSSGALSATVVANVAVFRGVDTTTPLLDIPVAFSAGAGGDVGAITGMTPSTGAGGVFVVAGVNNDDAPTDLGGSWVPVFKNGSTLGNDAGVIAEWMPWTSGAVADVSWPIAGTPNWSGIMVSLKEAAAAGSTVKALAALGVG